MKLRLKEDRWEWFKFTALAAIFAGLIGLALRRRGVLAVPFWTLFLPGILALGIRALRPRWLRSFYRLGMTISHRMGGVMGTLLLSLFFLFVLTPMGWMLRLSGKDLLNLKKATAPSYWRTVKDNKKLDQLF